MIKCAIKFPALIFQQLEDGYPNGIYLNKFMVYYVTSNLVRTTLNYTRFLEGNFLHVPNIYLFMVAELFRNIILAYTPSFFFLQGNSQLLFVT